MLEDVIPEEVLTDDLEIVEELPVDSGIDVVEEPVFNEENVGNEIFSEEDPADLLMEEEPEINELQQEGADGDEQVSKNQNIEVAGESGSQTSEEEILLNLEKIAISAEVTQANVKTGFENLQMLSTCSIGLNALLFGGFVIFCYLNRMG